MISSEKVALIELVKNSYDADASVVIIAFREPLFQGVGGIDVWDDGHGMDAGTITGTWFEIATPHRRASVRTAVKNRRVLGEKGIGRLAASRLGRSMRLVTRKANEEELAVVVDWSDFEADDKYLDEVDIRWFARQPETFATLGDADQAFKTAGVEVWQNGQGTHIKIDALTSNWTRKDVADLRMALSRLLAPVSSITDVHPDLRVVLDLPGEFQDLSGEVTSPPELERSHYRLIGSVGSDGKAWFSYSRHDGFEEEVNFFVTGPDGSAPRCGPIDLDVRVWDRDTDALRNLLPDASVRSVRQMLTDASGVSVYRDGFRVLPYGEKGDDWLSMDARRVQNPTLRLSNNQVLGHVFISSDLNGELRDQSNREGLIDGPALDDLRRIVTAAIEQIEVRRYKYRRPERKKSSTGGLFSRFNLDAVREAIAEQKTDDNRIILALDSAENDLREGVEEVQRIIAQYSRLAAMGMLIDRVVHDGRTAVSHLMSISRFALRDLAKTTLSDEEKLQISHKSFSQSKAQVELLRTLFRMLEPFGGRRRGRPAEVSLLKVAHESADFLAHEADQDDIDITVLGDDFNVTADEPELQQILINLLTNAMYWVKVPDASLVREIRLEVQRDSDGYANIVVSDSGPGVNPDVAELIFDPYFSERPNGVGLGLGIVGNIASDYYNGSLELLESGPLSGASFRVQLRKRV
ncbi:sensor histidine kinase [Pseudarthrobacter oxydans]|uniref:sensor histidine kinase n=1 Tax=Pseudarthrobacter oxydans TaxID=1671 RepID=UPI00344F9D1B